MISHKEIYRCFPHKKGNWFEIWDCWPSNVIYLDWVILLFFDLRYSEIFGVLVVKIQSVVTLTTNHQWPATHFFLRTGRNTDPAWAWPTGQRNESWQTLYLNIWADLPVMKEQGKNLLRRWTVPTVAQVICENESCNWQTLMGSPEQLLRFGSTFATWKTHVNNAYWTVSLCEQQLTLCSHVCFFWSCLMFFVFLCFFTVFRDFWRKEQT